MTTSGKHVIIRYFSNNKEIGGKVMATFVGAEYIIANLLIAVKKNHNRDSISLGELSSAGVYIQRQSLEKDIDAFFCHQQTNFQRQSLIFRIILNTILIGKRFL